MLWSHSAWTASSTLCDVTASPACTRHLLMGDSYAALGRRDEALAAYNFAANTQQGANEVSEDEFEVCSTPAPTHSP